MEPIEPITSREAIATDADERAKWWVTNPHQPVPGNPYDANLQPEHFQAWRASFERSLLLHSTGEVSA